jgi:hypothetical protein
VILEQAFWRSLRSVAGVGYSLIELKNLDGSGQVVSRFVVVTGVARTYSLFLESGRVGMTSLELAESRSQRPPSQLKQPPKSIRGWV